MNALTYGEELLSGLPPDVETTSLLVENCRSRSYQRSGIYVDQEVRWLRSQLDAAERLFPPDFSDETARLRRQLDEAERL